MLPFNDLQDTEWDVIGALFCDDPMRNERRGRPRVDPREVVNGVLWLLSTGEGWSKLPGRYPSPPTCRRRFEKWQSDGTLAEMFRRLASCGREVQLHGSIVVTAGKLPGPGSLDRLRGAFWTNPEVWCAPAQTAQPVISR
jgi:putative transposase